MSMLRFIVKIGSMVRLIFSYGCRVGRCVALVDVFPNLQFHFRGALGGITCPLEPRSNSMYFGENGQFLHNFAHFG